MSIMFRTLTTEETQDLLLELHSELPGSGKIYYALRNHLQNLLTGFEVIVDQWPQWKNIILRAENKDFVPQYFQNYYICHTRSIKDFNFFVQRPGVVDWTKQAIFTGIPYDVVGIIQERGRKEQGDVTSLEHRFMYAWTKKEFPEPAVIPEDLELTELQVEHAEILCDHWKDYRTNNGLLEYFRKVIQHFASSAITTKDGHLVAYICMQYNGSMANLFVDPEYHSANLGVNILKDLTRKLLNNNEAAYGFIKTKDSAFISTCQSIGFSWVPQGSMSWVRFCPKKTEFSPKTPRFTALSIPGNKIENEDADMKDLYLNALPLSCNKCSGIPALQKESCIHVSMS